MPRTSRFEGRLLIAPLTAFLIALLGFPLVLDIIYSISRVGFENIRAPEPIGLSNYAKAVADPEFWGAAWFSLRFGLIVSVIQVVAGLAEFFAPDALVGRQVVVVANLKPRELRGHTSHGMIVAVRTPGGMELLTASGPVPPGSRAS